MNEFDWYACPSPTRLLDVLLQLPEKFQTRMGQREGRLLACAYARVMPVKPFDRNKLLYHQAVEVGERYADQGANEAERESVWMALRGPITLGRLLAGDWRLPEMIYALCVMPSPGEFRVSHFPRRDQDDFFPYGSATYVTTDVWHALRILILDHSNTNWVREIVGYPFHLYTGQDLWPVVDEVGDSVAQTARGIAQATYDKVDSNGQMDPERLLILADSLLDAGCQNAALLHHLRKASHGHPRGCWAVDLILQTSPFCSPQ